MHTAVTHRRRRAERSGGNVQHDIDFSMVEADQRSDQGQLIQLDEHEKLVHSTDVSISLLMRVCSPPSIFIPHFIYHLLVVQNVVDNSSFF